MDTQVKRLFASIGKLITSSLELNDILEKIMTEICIFFNPENWSLMRLSPETNELFFVIINGSMDQERVKHIRLKVGEGIAGTVAQTGKAIFVPDAAQDDRFSKKVDELTGFETKSIIAVPLVCRGVVYGVIEIINGKDFNHFTEDEYLVLESIADFSAIAFANAAMYDHLFEVSHRDPLTGAYNRASLDEIIQDMENDSFHKRKDDLSLFTLIVVDLDGFKRVNDEYGHLEGDNILKKTVNALNACIRKNDMVFRFGGDEFVIMLSSASEAQARQAENRVLQVLETLSNQGISKDPSVGFSYGYASGPGAKARELIRTADENMYIKKKERARS